MKLHILRDIHNRIIAVTTPALSTKLAHNPPPSPQPQFSHYINGLTVEHHDLIESLDPPPRPQAKTFDVNTLKFPAVIELHHQHDYLFRSLRSIVINDPHATPTFGTGWYIDTDDGLYCWKENYDKSN